MKKIPMYKRDLPDFDLAEIQKKRRKIILWTFMTLAFIAINVVLYLLVTY